MRDVGFNTYMDLQKVIDKECISGYNNQALARVLEW